LDCLTHSIIRPDSKLVKAAGLGSKKPGFLNGSFFA
jgi:hypothetical protein